MFKWFKRKKMFSLIAKNDKEVIYLIVDEESNQVSMLSQIKDGIYRSEYKLVKIERNK